MTAQPARPLTAGDRRAPTGRPLAAQQLEVAALVAQGCTYGQIADRLGVIESTAKSYVGRALHRAGARNGAHLVAILIRSGQLVWHDDDLVAPSPHQGRAA